MIHIDCKESSLYPGEHLTREERLHRLVQHSKARARYMESHILFQINATRSINPDVAHFHVVLEPSMYYVAQIRIGSFQGQQQPFLNYYLMVDTGSSFTWLQCEGATKTFTQDTPIYPWNSSITYRPLSCNKHRFCEGKCNADGQCTYVEDDATGSFTSSIVVKEKFTVGSNTGVLESIDLKMGYGFRQHNFNQFLGDAGQGKFSYCLETYDPNVEGSNTYLRFGADTTIGGGDQEVHTTPIVVNNFLTRVYYLNLEDISVGNKRVGFSKGTFEINKQGGGGTSIDSGTIISVMYKDHFDKVADLVKAHFHELDVKYIGSRQDFGLCFQIPEAFTIVGFPFMTLHFQHADYIIPHYKANFVMISNGIYCLGIIGGDTNWVAFALGAMQQANKRILYNIKDQSLSFAIEDCKSGS
ncbi:aspartic proteinase nepenthesin-2-like [Papaver somniferum]|uniref:aspartic proteinase nepenthesin-2-like n=1 Tax=Papaver somniferum TaxID=3469 RepID=UPI000E6F6A4E|nr:aspartic proteinase nepenthesin-2-like [Papaver somniferum]